MSIGQNNPTRMELMKLKSKLTMSQRGHKLLKDKQDELIHQFVLLVHRARDLRIEVDSLLSNAVSKFVKIKEKMALIDIYEMLMIPSESVKIDYDVKSVMTVEIPNIDYHLSRTETISTYSDITSPIEIDFLQDEMLALLPKIIKLAEFEQRILLLSDEIEKTRRRVNVIEHVMIPELEVEIKRITMKLEDNERSNIVRIMKSKEIVVEKMLLDRKKRAEREW